MIRLVLADMDETLKPSSSDAVSSRTVAAVEGLRAAGIEFGPASGRPRFDLVRFFHALKATLGGNPLEDLAAYVDTPAVGRVVERPCINLRLEAQHRGYAGEVIRDDVLAHDDDLDACGPDVFLHACMRRCSSRPPKENPELREPSLKTTR